MKLRKGGESHFWILFFFAEGILTDRSRQNYFIHNTKIHCARTHSSIPFFR